jgi:TolA-binding protein
MVFLPRLPSGRCVTIFSGLTLKGSALPLLLASYVGLSGCVTPQQKRDQDDKIFALQTHLLQLESNLAAIHTADQKAGETHHKVITSTSSDVERLGVDVKRIKGDIDALKIGVETGQMPGQEAPQSGSVGAQLIEINARLEAIETQQRELATALEHMSAPPRKTSAKRDAATSSPNADQASLKNAFERKHYKEVAEDAPTVLKKVKGSEREDTLILYGESLLKLNRPKEAALQFNELVELKPNDKRMAAAKLRLGDAFKMMGEMDTSKLFYDEVATKYAGTPEGDKASRALKSMKSLK